MTIASRTAAILVVGIVCTGLIAQAGNAAERRSGRVIAVDDTAGLIVIDEVGRWQVRRGVTQMVRHTMIVTPSTKIASHIRVSVAGRFPGDFIEVPLALSDVAVGEFVTVEYRREGGRFIALSIAVAELGPAIVP